MTVWTRASRDPVPFITAAFWLAALTWGLRGTVASDEGMLTWFSAALMHDSFSAGLFLQRFHPTLGLLYLPTVPFGWGAFVVAHATVAALGVFAAGRWTQRLGGHGALGALALALAPAYLYGAATGQSNTDGNALLLIGLALYDGDTARARFAGGVVLGMTLWARFELAPVIGALALFALWRRERRAALAGMVVWPIAYLAAGALYHRAGLWFLRYPPMEGAPAPGIREAFQLRVNLDAAQRVIFAWPLVSGAWSLLLNVSMPAAAISSPPFLACASPSAVRSTSTQPVKRFSRFHWLWPWRSRTSVGIGLPSEIRGMSARAKASPRQRQARKHAGKRSVKAHAPSPTPPRML